MAKEKKASTKRSPQQWLINRMLTRFMFKYYVGRKEFDKVDALLKINPEYTLRNGEKRNIFDNVGRGQPAISYILRNDISLGTKVGLIAKLAETGARDPESLKIVASPSFLNDPINAGGQKPLESLIGALKTAGAKIGAKEEGKDQTHLHSVINAGLSGQLNQQKSKEALNALINQGARLDAKDANGRTPMHLAIRALPNENSLGLISSLAEGREGLDFKDSKGRTPISYFLDKTYKIDLSDPKNKKILDLLVAKTSFDLGPLLHETAHRRRPEVHQALSDSIMKKQSPAITELEGAITKLGAKTPALTENKRTSVTLFSGQPRVARNAITKAIETGDIEALAKAMKENPSITHAGGGLLGKAEKPLVYYAVKHADPKNKAAVLKCLIANGADVFAEDAGVSGKNALYSAGKRGDKAAYQVIFDAMKEKRQEQLVSTFVDQAAKAPGKVDAKTLEKIIKAEKNPKSLEALKVVQQEFTILANKGNAVPLEATTPVPPEPTTPVPPIPAEFAAKSEPSSPTVAQRKQETRRLSASSIKTPSEIQRQAELVDTLIKQGPKADPKTLANAIETEQKNIEQQQKIATFGRSRFSGSLETTQEKLNKLLDIQDTQTQLASRQTLNQSATTRSDSPITVTEVDKLETLTAMTPPPLPKTPPPPLPKEPAPVDELPDYAPPSIPTAAVPTPPPPPPPPLGVATGASPIFDAAKVPPAPPSSPSSPLAVATGATITDAAKVPPPPPPPPSVAAKVPPPPPPPLGVATGASPIFDDAKVPPAPPSSPSSPPAVATGASLIFDAAKVPPQPPPPPLGVATGASPIFDAAKVPPPPPPPLVVATGASPIFDAAKVPPPPLGVATGASLIFDTAKVPPPPPPPLGVATGATITDAAKVKPAGPRSNLMAQIKSRKQVEVEEGKKQNVVPAKDAQERPLIDGKAPPPPPPPSVETPEPIVAAETRRNSPPSSILEAIKAGTNLRTGEESKENAAKHEKKRGSTPTMKDALENRLGKMRPDIAGQDKEEEEEEQDFDFDFPTTPKSRSSSVTSSKSNSRPVTPTSQATTQESGSEKTQGGFNVGMLDRAKALNKKAAAAQVDDDDDGWDDDDTSSKKANKATPANSRSGSVSSEMSEGTDDGASSKSSRPNSVSSSEFQERISGFAKLFKPAVKAEKTSIVPEGGFPPTDKGNGRER